MHPTRIPIPILVAAIGLSLVTPAGAIGFGLPPAALTLGQPLDLRIPVRLDAGETLEPECVRAEVSFGEQRLQASGIGASVVGSEIVVRTLARIDEPVVQVRLEAGCRSVVARSFTFFADPPMVVAPATVAAVAAAPAAILAAAPPERVAAASAATAATRVGVTAAPAPAAEPAPRPRPRPRVRPPAPPKAAAPVADARPRLKLDAAPPPVAAAPPAAPPAEPDAAALALIDQANEAVKAAIEAASASQGRIAALEEQVRALQARTAAQGEEVDGLRQRASRAETRSHWVMPLGVAVLALLALAGWLWLRLREIERDRQRSWLAAARAPAPPAPPVPPSPSQVPLLVERSVRGSGGAALGAGLAPVHQPTPSELPEPPVTVPAPPEAATATEKTAPRPPDDPSARDMTAEELIDLEQQAEFFVVLGQDDAAVDLLVSHLRGTGGASPLPYLKLLDIHRRVGDREAYERTRERFNQRFNARAPGWEAPPGQGRTLEEYPAVVGWIQHVWPRPLDAMAEIESLLFRRDGGELFELPAYRELLLLYAMARELLDSEGSRAAAGIDVLLPLSDAAAFLPTSPRPYFGDDEPPPPDVQATAPLDLSLDDEPPPDPRRRF